MQREKCGGKRKEVYENKDNEEEDMTDKREREKNEDKGQ
jgi:hypothetical protein